MQKLPEADETEIENQNKMKKKKRKKYSNYKGWHNSYKYSLRENPKFLEARARRKQWGYIYLVFINGSDYQFLWAHRAFPWYYIFKEVETL